MSVTLNRSRPEGVPAGYQGNVSYHIKSNTHVNRKLKTEFTMGLAIYQTLGKISGTLEALSLVHGMGNISLIMTADDTKLIGEFTVFDPAADEAIDHVLKFVDAASYSLRREYASQIEHIEIVYTQTCECTPV